MNMRQSSAVRQDMSAGEGRVILGGLACHNRFGLKIFGCKTSGYFQRFRLSISPRNRVKNRVPILCWAFVPGVIRLFSITCLTLLYWFGVGQ